MPSAAVHVVGSINIDHHYRVSHLPQPGETLRALDYRASLGGKGANQAIAAARAGAAVHMIGAIGDDGAWTLERLAAEGISVTGVARLQGATGHARIEVDVRGENRIVLHGGANRQLELGAVRTALARARPGDWLLLQNETSLVVETARLARALGLQVAYSAAPFDASAVAEVLPQVDLLAVNEIEAGQIEAQLGRSLADIGLPLWLVTAGARGARLQGSGAAFDQPAWVVDPVDTTGAGDVFLGYLVAALARAATADEAMRQAAAAAALQVTRPGAADAIPLRTEVLAFLQSREASR